LTDLPWPADQVVRRAVAELIPYARNARTHSPGQVAEIAGSIREWGWTIPVLVDESGGIIAGHGRVLAALQLGLETVPVMIARGWSEAQKRAYVIADNRLAENAGWDENLLRIELGDLDAEGFALDLLGFGDKLADLLIEEAAPDGFPGFDEGIDTEHECPKCHFRWSGSSKPDDA
jgi:ParB-like chromosome segregation protein Spo0J